MKRGGPYLALMLCASLAATWRTGETQDAQPTISLAKPAAAYLSSDGRIEGALTIDNPTDRPFRF